MRIQKAIKRLCDVVLASTALIVLSPALVIVAIAIAVTSPGPVFYRQERLGMLGKPFRIVKFRSMRVDADRAAIRDRDGANVLERADPRITSVGRVIRETSLDELPQLWNVLVGDMSLVGPRPDEVHALKLYEGNERLKLKMRPGITGLAMVNGRNSIPWRKRIEWDVRYVEEFSLWLDLRIMMKTVKVLLFREGIYTSQGPGTNPDKS